MTRNPPPPEPSRQHKITMLVFGCVGLAYVAVVVIVAIRG